MSRSRWCRCETTIAVDRSASACRPIAPGVCGSCARRTAGAPRPTALIDLAERHQQADIDEIEERGPLGIEPEKTFWEQGLHEDARRMLEWLRLHRELLLG